MQCPHSDPGFPPTACCICYSPVAGLPVKLSSTFALSFVMSLRHTQGGAGEPPDWHLALSGANSRSAFLPRSPAHHLGASKALPGGVAERRFGSITPFRTVLGP